MANSTDSYGVHATVENFSQFISQIGMMSKETQKFGRTVTETVKAVNSSGDALTLSRRVADTAAHTSQATLKAAQSMTTWSRATQAFSSVATHASSAIRGLGSVLGNILTIAGGILAAQLFQRIGQAIFGIAREAFDAAASFQTLEVRLTTLAARQFRAADAGMSLDESLRVGALAAKEYLRWVEILALKTPFKTGDIAQLFTLAQAYNFTSEEAKRLTESIVNFASGMGLGGAEMTRIIENFGQMRAAAKVTGTELRDLARGAFVPVNDVLRRTAENLNIPIDKIQEFRKAAAEGAVSVDEFINAFSDLVEEEFVGAAERMSRTWVGLTEKVSDFIQTVIGVEILGPVLASLSAAASTALDTLINEETLSKANLLGQALAMSFDRIWAVLNGQLIPALQKLAAALGLSLPSLEQIIGLISAFTQVTAGLISGIANFVDGLANTIGGTLSSFAQNAYDWGVNIIAQLSNGIIQGGATLLAQAMQWIGRLLSSWLAPGSPPKVAQDILKWGAGTFEEYLKGFAKADFGVLNDLQSPLKSALDILTQVEAISKDDAYKLFANISEGIAAAIADFDATGQINGDVFEALNSEAGAFGDELKTLLELELQYRAAVEAVEIAQAALNAALDAQKAAQTQVKGLTEEYNALLRAGADESVLRAKLAEINAAEEARALAIEQAHAAEEALENAEAAVGPIQDQLEAQKELIAQLLELARLQASMNENKTGGAGGGGGGPETPGGPAGPPLPTIDPLLEDFEDFFDRLGQLVFDELNNIFQFFIDIWNAIVAWLKEKWQQIIDFLTRTGLLEIWRQIWEDMKAIVVIAWGLLVEFIRGGLQTLASLWKIHTPPIEQIWRTFWRLIGDIAVTALVFVSQEIRNRLDEIRGWFELNRTTLSGIITEFWKMVFNTINFWMTQAEIFVQERLNAMTANWEIFKMKIPPKVSTMFTLISGIFGSAMTNLVSFVQGVLARINAFWDEHGASITLIVRRFLQAIGGLFDIFYLTSILFWSFVLDIWNGILESGGEILKETVDDWLYAIEQIVQGALDFIGGSLDTWAALISGDWDAFWEGIKTAAEGAWTLIKGVFQLAFDSIVNSLRSTINLIVEIFTGLWNALVGHSIIPEMLEDIKAVFAAAWAAVVAALNTFVEVVKAKWYLFLNSIKTAIELAKLRFVTAFEGVFKAVKTAVETIWGGIKTAFNDFLELDLLEAVRGFIADFYTAGKNLVMGIIDGMISQGGALFAALKALVLNAINGALGSVGLPPLLGGGGGEKGGTKGVGTGTKFGLAADDMLSTLGYQAGVALAPPAQVEAPATTYNTTLNFNTTINDGMDAAEYQAFVKKTIDDYLP